MSGFGPEDDLDLLNEEGVEHLEPPPTIGPDSGPTVIDGIPANQMGSVSSSPPILASASRMPATAKIKVWRNENGTEAWIGTIGAKATEREFVETFMSAMPKPGEGPIVFKLRPARSDNTEMGQQYEFAISDSNIELQRIRNRAFNIPGMPPMSQVPGMPQMYPYPFLQQPQAPAAPSTDPKMLDIMQKQLEIQAETARAERERYSTMLQQTAQTQVDAASNAARTVETVTERLMNEESRRAERSLEIERQRGSDMTNSMAAFFQGQLAAMQLQMQAQAQQQEMERVRREDEYRRRVAEEEDRRRRERDELEARRKAEQTEAEFKRRQERDELESRRKAERDEADARRRQEIADAERRERLLLDEQRRLEERRKLEADEREKERQRQHEMRLEEMKIAAQRDREHMERMAQLQTTQLQVHAGAEGNAGLQNLLEKGAGLLKTVGIEPTAIIAKLLNPGDGGEAGANASAGWAQALSSLTTGAAEVAKAAIQAKAQAQSPQPQIVMPAGTSMVPMPTGMVPMYGPVQQEPEQQQQFEVPPGSIPVEGQQMQSQLMQPEQPNPANDLPLVTQKAARMAVRNLVRQASGKSPDQWITLAAQAIGNEPILIPYFERVPVAVALREAGASPNDIAAALQTIQTLKVNGMIPDSIRIE